MDGDILKEIGGACIAHADHSLIGGDGGQVDVFTPLGRFHAAYGHPDGGDPIREWCGPSADLYGLDAAVMAAGPFMCTLMVHDGVVEADVRRMAPLSGPDAYAYVVDGVEMERRFIHEEFPEGTWSDDAESAWAAFREEVEDLADNVDISHGILNCATVTLLFQLSEIRERHYLERRDDADENHSRVRDANPLSESGE